MSSQKHEQEKNYTNRNALLGLIGTRKKFSLDSLEFVIKYNNLFDWKREYVRSNITREACILRRRGLIENVGSRRNRGYKLTKRGYKKLQYLQGEGELPDYLLDKDFERPRT